MTVKFHNIESHQSLNDMGTVAQLAKMIGHSILNPSHIDEDLEKQCDMAQRYHYKGATVADVKLMRKYSGPKVQVKYAGGVRTLDDLLRMKASGATRSRATATEAILEEAKKRFGES